MTADEHFCAKEENSCLRRLVWIFLRPHHAIFERLILRCKNLVRLATSHLLNIEWTLYLAWRHVFFIFSIFSTSRPKLSKRPYVSFRLHAGLSDWKVLCLKKSGSIFSLKKSIIQLLFKVALLDFVLKTTPRNILTADSLLLELGRTGNFKFTL